MAVQKGRILVQVAEGGFLIIISEGTDIGSQSGSQDPVTETPLSTRKLIAKTVNEVIEIVQRELPKLS